MTKLGSTIVAIGLFALISPTYTFSQILGIKGEKHSSIGIYIKDLNADTIVFESEAERNLAPASIMKSFTSASALTLLGKDYRFKTNVKLVGSRTDADGEWSGDLVVVPSGDPTIESEHFAANKGFCDSIVSNLKRLGIKKITGAIKVNERMSEDGPVAQWEIDDMDWSYGAGLFDFNYRGNALNSNSPMSHPADVFMSDLTKKLGLSGIELGNAKNVNTAETVKVYEHSSPKLIDILQSLMERSDNMFAEGVLRAFAPHQDRSEAIKAETALWKGRGFATEYITVKDGSGLARVNRVSPRFIGDMLAWMSKSKMSNDYVSLFPIAGKTGTVKSFMLNTRLTGKLVLKTGSMNGVQCYAGYKIDDAGKPTHVVVIMANSFFGTRADLRVAITNFLLNKL
jgi:D-alanyl-D-alanine carboxypeptidase